MTHRLSDDEAARVLSRAVPIPAGHHAPQHPRTELRGRDAHDADVEVRLEALSLVLFLSTTCDGCGDLASLVREGVAGCSTIGVLRVPAEGLPDTAASAFIGDQGRWLFGDDAFDAFGVRAAPFFCVLDAGGSVVVEGVAFGADHVAEHCRRALAGTARPDAVRLTAENR